jgi:hypothetical protein
MPLADAYRKQVALLIKIVPLVGWETDASSASQWSAFSQA